MAEWQIFGKKDTSARQSKKKSISFALRSLNRTLIYWSKILTLGKTQTSLIFRSLNRIFAS